MSLIDPGLEASSAQLVGYSGLRDDHRRIWLRVQIATERGKGVRLTPHEVSVLAETDFREDPAIADSN